MTATDAERHDAAQRFVHWLEDRLHSAASGSGETARANDPLASLWLGRLAPAREIALSDLGERAERLEPCAVGMRLAPPMEEGAIEFMAHVRFHLWRRVEEGYEKVGPVEAEVPIGIGGGGEPVVDGRALDGVVDSVASGTGLAVRVEVELRRTRRGPDVLEVTLVNVSKPSSKDADHTWCRLRLFECILEVRGLRTRPFVLEALPDGFRYDRSVPAWGINCGVVAEDDVLRTVDLPTTVRRRPTFWTVDDPEPDFRFETFAEDPLPPLEALVAAARRWGEVHWSEEAVRSHVSEWTEETVVHLARERAGFHEELARLERGLEALRTDGQLLRAFRLMNAAIGRSARGRYDRWRAFQLGFMLANIVACRGEEDDLVDIVWFPTGGGKTETYLGLVLTTAFHDRLRGKRTGVTAWARFPLRLLSLQQTQRFANALAAAELVRRDEGIDGDPFGLGFLIGGSATPNSISDEPGGTSHRDWTANDPNLEERCRQITICPFCRGTSVRTRMNRALWRLEHRCRNADCPWPSGTALPIWVVDDDVWRFLPTVVVGTLDKAANVSRQASMRGLFSAPLGFCTRPDHGHTYAPRSKRPQGCLVPGCTARKEPVPQEERLYGPTLRLQDELHLLRDSLGAVDAHYEAILDDLQMHFTGTRPKILASSATLTGYERQADVLYRRRARVFPHPEPRVGRGFWIGETDLEMRRFLAAAPRGVTIEYALDRTVVALQTAVRDVIADPAGKAAEIGIDPSHVPFLVGIYGTNVVYGNTIRDLDAVARSSETQWGDVPAPDPQVTSMTGRTSQTDIAGTLERLENPEPDFADRLHVVTASSMMSHGVDIDRLNVMAVLGLPLTTAEFIQATARVGRRWPSLVLVLHKIGRERDASVYRSFPKWVEQGDRFVEPVPITATSRRVLERTIPGLAFARLLAIHEPDHGRFLMRGKELRRLLEKENELAEAEVDALIAALELDQEGREALRRDVEAWYEQFARNLSDPAAGNDWASDLSPTGPPMMSLRDVEEQVEVWGKDPS